MNNQNNKLDIEKGSIIFWIEAGKSKFDDNQRYILVSTNSSEGSILVIKDEDNKIKFSHDYFSKGRTDVEWDCSKLSNDKKHMIAVTWSQEDKEIKLYIDGHLKKTSSIKY